MNQNSYSDPACPRVNIGTKKKERTDSLQAGRVASADEKNSSPLAQALCGFSGCKHTTTLIPLISSEASPGPMMRNTWFHYKAFKEAWTMEESIRSCRKTEQDGEGSAGWVSYSAESHTETPQPPPPPHPPSMHTHEPLLWRVISLCHTVAQSINRYYLVLTGLSRALSVHTRIDSYHTDVIRNHN